MISAFSSDPGAKNALLEVQPFHRFGEATEIADTVVFLCSDDANGISGAEISVDGALGAQLKV
jgi:NAD(P)-dependent dehydrogenase (short-subunit alcohol dehydrogenase family)